MRRNAEHIYDEYLVAAARAGDRPSLESLAARFQGRLLAHAWRLTGDPDMAREATQDAWIEIVRSLPRLADSASFPAWAFRIVTRRCAKCIRQHQRVRCVREVVSASSPTAEPLNCPQETWQDGHALAGAVAALPPDQRAAIALYYLEDFSVAEVAVALGAPVGTVKTRLMHARRKLKTFLEGDHDA